MRSSSEMVIMLDRKSLRAEIGFSNTISSFNRPVIGRSSFFLPTFFKVFCLSLSSRVFWFTLGCRDGGPTSGGFLSTSSNPCLPSPINMSACMTVLPTVTITSFSGFLGAKMYVTLLESLEARRALSQTRMSPSWLQLVSDCGDTFSCFQSS